VGAVRKRSFPLGPALIGSLALHVAIIGGLIFAFPREASQIVFSAVPVEILSPVQHEAAPAQETQPQPEPPAPQTQPQTQPTKPESSPKAEAQQKPQQRPDRTNDNPMNLVKGINGASSARDQPQRPPAHQPANGSDQVSTGPEVSKLGSKLMGLWHPNCGADAKIVVTVHFRLTFDARVDERNLSVEDPRTGRLVPFYDGPNKWSAPFLAIAQREGSGWEVAAERAAQAVKHGQPYRELPSSMYGQDIPIKFDAKKACF
jgi:protein TonB